MLQRRQNGNRMVKKGNPSGLPHPIVDGGHNLGTEHDGERPFRDEIDQEDYQGLFSVLEVKPFKSILDLHCNATFKGY